MYSKVTLLNIEYCGLHIFDNTAKVDIWIYKPFMSPSHILKLRAGRKSAKFQTCKVKMFFCFVILILRF